MKQIIILFCVSTICYSSYSMENFTEKARVNSANSDVSITLTQPKVLSDYKKPHDAGISKKPVEKEKKALVVDKILLELAQQELQNRLNSSESVVAGEKRRRERINGTTGVHRKQRRVR